jgi:formylglycine-generating enzyme required for sulfatase activity
VPPADLIAHALRDAADLPETKFVTRMDADTLRAEYASLALKGTDVGIFPFTYGNSGDAQDDRCGANVAADPHVWWCANAPGQKTSPVGLKEANPYGLYDVHGNVGEWVEDWYGDYPAGAVTDPAGPSTGTWRVSRGGEFGSDLKSCRSAQCDAGRPQDGSAGVGFRLARSR